MKATSTMELVCSNSLRTHFINRAVAFEIFKNASNYRGFDHIQLAMFAVPWNKDMENILKLARKSGIDQIKFEKIKDEVISELGLKRSSV